MIKLSRKQTREALSSVPLDTLLLGRDAKTSKLTPREKRFAESLAMGKSKAQSYRDAVPHSVAKHETQSRRGVELASKGHVQAMVDALVLAQEAQRHSTPAALRALVIQQLTEHAINPDVQPAQRLRALELLGKVTEVAAFTERREIIKSTDVNTARSALLDSLRSALKAGAVDAAMTLTAQPTPDSSQAIDSQASMPMPDAVDAPPEGNPHALDAPPDADPATRAPLDQPHCPASTLLSNPHTQSPQPDEPPVTFSNNEGGGG